MQPQVTFGKRGAPLAASSPVRNGYAPMGGRPTSAAAKDLGSVDGADMAIAIGNNWRKYQAVWQELTGPWAPVASFSWTGLFIHGLWFLYRKQYSAFFATLLAPIAIGYVFPSGRLWIGFAVSLASAVYGKWWIARNTAMMVARTRSLGLSEEQTLTRIERQGGVSWVGPSVLLAIAVFAVLAVVTLVSLVIHKH